MAQPLSRTERIVIISGGADGAAGASRITRDVAEVIAPLPPIIEALTGVRLEELVRGVPGLKESYRQAEAQGSQPA